MEGFAWVPKAFKLAQPRKWFRGDAKALPLQEELRYKFNLAPCMVGALPIRKALAAAAQ